MESITAVGLLHPVVVDSDGRLISGARRLEAMKRLGWRDIPVRMLPLAAIVRGECDENTIRKDFVVTEAVAIATAVREEEARLAKQRQAAAGPKSGRGKKATGSGKLPEPVAGSGNLPETRKGQSRDKAARVSGKSATTLRKAEVVIAAAKEDPDAFGALPAEMDRTGRVDRAFRQVTRAKRHQEIAKADLAAPVGKYRVIYADPPWQYEHVATESRAIENQYPTMTLDKIRRLPIADLAEADAVLFLWATSPKVEEALLVMGSWGFTYRTCMVWVKDKIGMGYYARQRHELLLIGTRGKPPTPSDQARPDSVIEAPRGVHSVKPDVFADTIATMYPDWTRVELFARKARDGWARWGNQA